jgi:hypothetical protein
MFKKLLILLVIIFLASYAHKAFKAELARNLSLNTKVAAVTDVFDNIGRSVSGSFGNIKKAGATLIKKALLSNRAAPVESAQVEVVTLVMKYGGKMTGKLLKKNYKEYTLEVKGEKYVIPASKVKNVESGTQKGVEWPYENDVVVRRTNGIVLDGEIISADGNGVTLSFTEGGGQLESSIGRKDIDRLIFAPVCDKETENKEKLIKTQFPKMEAYKEGNVTIFTDAYPTAVTSYKKTINSLYTELYLTFFKLFKGRKPHNQCFIVIFDDFEDYVVFAATEGIPGWLAVGFFSPLEKVLYTYNAFGKRMEKYVYDVIIGKGCGAFDQIVEAVKKQVDERYHIFLEGQAKEISDKYWTIYSYYKNEMEEQTLSTIRHEFAHEVFHSWGLQNIVMSKPNIDEKRLAEYRKKILEATTWQEKEKLLNDIMRLKRTEDTDYSDIIDEGTAQSWLNEGIATYCGTDPVGGLDEDWLFTFQEAARKKELNPIEFLTSFKIGSFPGLSHKGMLTSYAESWALANFLMAKYPERFMEYQLSIIKKTPGGDQDEMELLLKTLGKDLPTLEKELTDYMKTYKPAEDPYIKRFMKHYDVWNDLRR